MQDKTFSFLTIHSDYSVKSLPIPIWREEVNNWLHFFTNSEVCALLVELYD